VSNFPSDRHGQFIGYKTDHDPRQRATSVGPFTSKSMVEHLEERVRSRGTEIVGGVRVVDLIVDRSGEIPRCVGLLGLRRDVVADQGCPFILIAARNVVLATGGPAGMFADSVWPHGQWGATGAALRAGAVGHNLPEFQFGLASLRPRWNVSGTYMQVVPAFVSVGPDGTEHDFLAEVIDDPGALTSLIFRKGYQWPFDIDKVHDGSSLIDIQSYGMGVAAGGNLNPDSGGASMFEPMGGSAPKYTGQNVINPIAAISAMSMLLEFSGFEKAGRRILAAVEQVTGTKMKSQAAGKMGYGTREVGDLVAQAL